MAYDWAKILGIQNLPSTAAAQYTLPSSTTAYINLMILYSGNTTLESVTLWNVPNGGSRGVATVFFHYDLSSYETYVLEFPGPGIILDTAGDAIHGITTTSSKVTIQIYGGLE